MDEPIIRRRISLDGTWDFGTDPTASSTPEQASTGRTIEVPGAWQAQHADLERYDGVAWYRRSIDVGPRESGMAPESAILHLGAVDYRCDVWINGQPAGGHVGGYTPVELEVGHLLAAGANTITVRVEDYAYNWIETDRWPDAVHRSPATDLLHGKQSWYLEISGIWGHAWLDLAADPNIASVHVTPDIRASSARVRVVIRGVSERGAIDTSGATRLSVSIAPPGGDPVATREVPVTGPEATFELPLPQARLWEPDDPFLYEAVATITRDGELLDGLRTRFGMREIRADGGRLWLNGRPLYLRAALDQDFYPETIYTPPSDDYLRNQFALAKEMGLNCLRAHIKPVDPRYLDLCDEIGLLVWAELPSWRTLWPKERLDSRVSVPLELQQEVERTFDEMVARDFNHPSIIIWTLVNEDWGTQLIFSESDRAWLGRFYERAKRIDPTRLVVDNSPCFSGHGPNFHVQSDLDDFHVYAAMPERYRNFQRWVEDFSLRPTWTYSTFGDAQRRGDEPL
ncbi:MAG TPA: glycoside hydrolase family 2 TIM barrel-domain containing protein, partial [Ardenticatenaceae bacterium]|nr:glycoside hydrolase family 2 TIM barrel-domain containing protein [Ardenticatenaceae bacterium]